MPLIFLAILLSLFPGFTVGNTLSPTRSLSDGETLISSGGVFALGFFSPDNSNNDRRYLGIWYNNIQSHTVIWVANRLHPVNGTTGILSITTSGTLIITDRVSSMVIWSFPTTAKVTNPIGQLLDSGNFVVSSASDSNNFAWQSFDYPTDTLVPGMKLGWNLTDGLNRNLTAWLFDNDPSPSKYTLAVDLQGVPEVRLWVGSTRAMRLGPWTGRTFSNLVPFDNSFTSQLKFSFVDNKEEVYYTCDVVDSSTITRLVVNSSGSLERYVWVDSGHWSLYEDIPRTQCHEVINLCGSNGVCNPDTFPICSCLPGFSPKFQANWDLRDWSGGCVRKTQLDCRNGTADGLLTVHQTFLPDTLTAIVDRRMILSECMAECLRNCSCTAVASAAEQGYGRGCIFWSMDLNDIQTFSEGGQDLYIRLAASDIDSIMSQSHKRRKSTLAIMLSAVLATLLFASFICFVWMKRKQTRGITSSRVKTITESKREGEIELPQFDLETVVAATNNFSIENKLGEGGFGPVYKGKMTEGQEIAVKRLSQTSVQGLDELKAEVMLVAKLQHRNLVRLLGYCIQGDERIIIYEYLPNKSLDAFLFDEGNRVILDWQNRYQIIHGIARGLLYLHQDSRFRIIHRDLKASNILLDQEMNPKISDFGLARIFGGDEAQTRTKRVVGTYGYMSPEYAMNGIFSTKSDVFSFGVLALEILSGKRNNGVYHCDSDEYLLEKAWTSWKEGNWLQLVDSSLDGSFSGSEVLRCIKIGLLCIQEYPRDRPTMSSVVWMLGCDHASLPEPKKPGFVWRESYQSETSSSKETSHSVNDVTITTCIGR